MPRLNVAILSSFNQLFVRKQSVKEEEREWAPILDIGSFSVGSTDKFSGHKSSSNEMTFESNLNLDLGESTIMDFFQSSFWDQY